MQGDRFAALRPLLLPVLLIVVALAAFNLRIGNAMVDFEGYRAAGRHAIAAEPLYRASQATDPQSAFDKLPGFAMAMAATTLFSDDTTRVAWYALSWACLVLLLRWSVVTLPERRWSERSLVIVAVVVLAKFYARELTLGQSDLLLAVVLMAGLGALQLEAPRVAASSFAAGVFLNPFAIVLLPWLVASYGFAPGLMACAILGAGLLLPAVFYGWTGNLEQLSDWWHLVTDAAAPHLPGASNVSLTTMWATWVGPGTIAVVLSGVSAILLLAVAATMWRQRKRVLEPDYTEFAFLILIIPLISPRGWDYLLLLGTPAVVCVVDRWRELRTPWRFASGTALAVMGFSLFDLLSHAAYGGLMSWSVVSLCALVVAATLAQLRLRALA